MNKPPRPIPTKSPEMNKRRQVHSKERHQEAITTTTNTGDEGQETARRPLVGGPTMNVQEMKQRSPLRTHTKPKKLLITDDQRRSMAERRKSQKAHLLQKSTEMIGAIGHLYQQQAPETELKVQVRKRTRMRGQNYDQNDVAPIEEEKKEEEDVLEVEEVSQLEFPSELENGSQNKRMIQQSIGSNIWKQSLSDINHPTKEQGGKQSSRQRHASP